MSVVCEHFEAVRQALAMVDSAAVEQIAEAILEAASRDHPVLCCGNGGSAATAIHFASDLRSVGVQAWDMLSPSKVTQIANDEGPSSAFSSQALQGALVIAFSGSGTSGNVERLLYVDGIDLIVVTSTMKAEQRAWDKHFIPRLDVIEVESDDYEVIEDVHLAICHAVKKALRERL
jgi:D-sedoheptulose 7-phosphate isomerase